jgi:hypothetical protein
VFAATDAQGRDRSDVRVLVDGRKLLDRLDGQPLPIEPGAHTLRYESSFGAAANQELVARVGEKNRIVSIRLEPPKPPAAPPPPPPPPERAPRPLPVAPIVLGGVAIAAFGVAAYFDVSAIGDAHALRATCDARCLPSDVDAVNTKYRVAGVALGVSVVAAGVALFLLLTRGEPPPSKTAGWTFTLDGGGRSPY